MSGTTSSGQRAARALDGISAHSRAVSQRRGLPEEHFFLGFEREAEPSSDQARLADLLRDLQHHAGRRSLGLPTRSAPRAGSTSATARIQAPQTSQDVQVDSVALASVVVATRPADLASQP